MLFFFYLHSTLLGLTTLVSGLFSIKTVINYFHAMTKGRSGRKRTFTQDLQPSQHFAQRLQQSNKINYLFKSCKTMFSSG